MNRHAHHLEAGRISFEVLDAGEDSARRRWCELHDISPLANLYNSWPWMETWSRIYGLPLQVVFVIEDSRPIGAFVLVRQRTWRRVFPVRVTCLGPCSANPGDIYLEYNQFLPAPDRIAAVGRAIASFALDDPSWQEWRLVGTEAGVAQAVLDHLPETSSFHETPSYFVRLAGDEDPIQRCSGNTRSQLRRSNRMLAEMGGRFEVARTVDSAREFLGQLVELHQRDWTARGLPGSFASPCFVEFHNRAVDRFFPQGSIYLARMRTERGVLGVVYGFLTRGRYDFYQSGLSPMTDNRIKLGYSLHYHSMVDLGRKDVTEYDFLAGTERYKSCWGGMARTMIWARLQRPLLRFRLEAGARRIVRTVGRPRR